MGLRAWRRWSGGFSATGALILQQKLLQELKINVDLRPPGLVNTPIMELEFPFNISLWLLVPPHFDLTLLSFWLLSILALSRNNRQSNSC